MPSKFTVNATDAPISMIDVLQANGVMKGKKIQGDPLNDSLSNSVLKQAYMFPDIGGK